MEFQLSLAKCGRGKTESVVNSIPEMLKRGNVLIACPNCSM